MLTGRCSAEQSGKTQGKRGTANSTEATYKLILESILTDQLTLLNYFEWPVATTICYHSCRLFIQYLDDPNKLGEGYLRNLATDWLGKLSSILRKPNHPSLLALLDHLNEVGLKGSVSKESSPESLDALFAHEFDLIEKLESFALEQSFKSRSIKFLISLILSQIASIRLDQSHPIKDLGRICSLAQSYKRCGPKLE
jgi:hypothetical protein